METLYDILQPLETFNDFETRALFSVTLGKKTQDLSQMAYEHMKNRPQRTTAVIEDEFAFSPESNKVVNHLILQQKEIVETIIGPITEEIPHKALLYKAMLGNSYLKYSLIASMSDSIREEYLKALDEQHTRFILNIEEFDKTSPESEDNNFFPLCDLPLEIKHIIQQQLIHDYIYNKPSEEVLSYNKNLYGK